jgi:hypothetical protein
MKLVAALKMLPTRDQATCLKATLARCNEACSWLAGVGFAAQTYRQFDLHNLATTNGELIRPVFGAITLVTGVTRGAKLSPPIPWGEARRVGRAIAAHKLHRVAPWGEARDSWG